MAGDEGGTPWPSAIQHGDCEGSGLAWGTETVKEQEDSHGEAGTSGSGTIGEVALGGSSCPDHQETRGGNLLEGTGHTEGVWAPGCLLVRLRAPGVNVTQEPVTEGDERRQPPLKHVVPSQVRQRFLRLGWPGWGTLHSHHTGG